MSREFPDIVDPWKAADGRRIFQGTMPLERMARLVALLAPVDEGAATSPEVVEFRTVFAYDRQGLLTIDVSVSAELPLQCQRSLAVFTLPVERRSRVVVIESVAEQDEVPEPYEPFLVEERRLALVDLVEEELLLAVPQVPVAPAAEAPELPGSVALEDAPEEPAEQTHRPFSGLAGLMKDTSDS
jgi:uncharacterized protein